MRVNNSQNSPQNVSFGRALTGKEEKLFAKTADSIQKLLGNAEGDTVFIMPAPSLPSKAGEDTGIGKLCSDTASDFFDMVKTYTRANVIKLLPVGRTEKGLARQGKFLSYSGSSMSLGEQNIDLLKLTTKEYGEILPKADFEELQKNQAQYLKANEENASRINFENELGEGGDSPVLKKLRVAFDNFKKGSSDEVKKLQGEFQEYQEKEGERLEKVNFIGDDQEFFNFWQFLADKHLAQGRENLNKKGMDLCMDVPLNSGFERHGYPEAFSNDSVGWGMAALDMGKVGTKNEHGDFTELGPTGKFLKAKFKFFADRSDRQRLDVSRYYAQPYIRDGNNQVHNLEPQGDSVLKLIEKTVQESHGDKFSPSNITHEIQAGPGDGFGIFTNGADAFKDRTKIFTQNYEGDYNDNIANLTQGRGLSKDEFIIGANNHDHEGVRELAESPHLEGRREDARGPISYNLKVDRDSLKDPKEFAKAKMATPYLTKKRLMFFSDFLGRAGKFDDGTKEAYRSKVTPKFEQEYHQKLQEGHGFNLMESLTMAMKAKGLDKENSELYEQAQKLGRTLREEGAKTKAEAEELASKKKLSKPETATIKGKEEVQPTTNSQKEASKTEDKSETKSNKTAKVAATLAGLAGIGGIAYGVSKKNKNQNK